MCPSCDRSVLLETEVTFFFLKKQKCPFHQNFVSEVSFALAEKFRGLLQKLQNLSFSVNANFEVFLSTYRVFQTKPAAP